MAAFAQQPDVADFLDVVVHDEDVEYRLEEFRIPHGSRLAGRSLGEVHIRREIGALVLAIRNLDGSFLSIPDPQEVLAEGTTLIAMGTPDQIAALEGLLS
jgi:voltage-gated potassium channel